MSVVFHGKDNNDIIQLPNKFEFLFEDSKRRKDQKDILYSKIPDLECTFHPDIRSTQDTVSKHKSQTPHNPKNRTHNYLMDSEKNLFKPKVGRKPKNERNINNLPIGEYLFGLKNMQEQKKTLLNIGNDNEKQLFKKGLIKYYKNLQYTDNFSGSPYNSSFVQEESKKIVENRKQANFAEFFKILDDDDDGIISATNINLKGLTEDIMEIYAPLLLEIEEKDQFLNQEDFIKASTKLYRTLTIKEKDILLGFGNKHSKEKDNKKNHKFQVK